MLAPAGILSALPSSSAPEFAHKNRIYWLCRQPCANHAGARALFPSFPVTEFAHKNRIHWLCQEACANQPEPGPPFPLFPARWFAYENRIHWFCRQVSANPGAMKSKPASGKQSQLDDEQEHARLGQPGWHERRIRDVSPGGSLIACSSRLIVKLLLAGAGLLFF